MPYKTKYGPFRNRAICPNECDSLLIYSSESFSKFKEVCPECGSAFNEYKVGIQREIFTKKHWWSFYKHAGWQSKEKRDLEDKSIRLLNITNKICNEALNDYKYFKELERSTDDLRCLSQTLEELQLRFRGG